MTTQLLIAGFGGQGVLFAGKFLAYKGLIEGRQLSWLPSYGPEMRGGTANCSVILSDEPVGSPIVSKPDALIVMNLPSLDKYEDSVVSGGSVFVDSTLIERKLRRDDVKAFYVPATALANELGTPSLANMIMVGHMSAPALAGDNTPSSLSSAVVTDILRNELNFRGVIITDAMNMAAISNYYGADEAAIMALKAGCDMILMPEDFEKAYNGVLEAVRNGTISEERINDSLRRIYRIKYADKIGQ